MTKFKVVKDYSALSNAGVDGMFEIEMLWKNGVDVTSQIDQEKPFSDEDSSELISYLSKIFSLPEEEIVFEPEEDDEDPDWPYK